MVLSASDGRTPNCGAVWRVSWQTAHAPWNRRSPFGGSARCRSRRRA
ncbi:Uncharacterised protein [Bordetella pertussis]|nr:Uncharacterised protein [Bordetella pertussis]